MAKNPSIKIKIWIFYCPLDFYSSIPEAWHYPSWSCPHVCLHSLSTPPSVPWAWAVDLPAWPWLLQTDSAGPWSDASARPWSLKNEKMDARCLISRKTNNIHAKRRDKNLKSINVWECTHVWEKEITFVGFRFGLFLDTRKFIDDWMEDSFSRVEKVLLFSPQPRQLK